jgi:hypothetical protein
MARTAVLMETVLAKERGHRELAERAMALAAKALANERHRREAAKCAAALAIFWYNLSFRHEIVP